jgi:hypothetical protein
VSDPGEHWIAIGSYAAAADAQADALVLAAVGIGSHIVVLGHGLGLLVAERDAVRAHREIQDYRREKCVPALFALRPQPLQRIGNLAQESRVGNRRQVGDGREPGDRGHRRTG